MTFHRSPPTSSLRSWLKAETPSTSASTPRDPAASCATIVRTRGTSTSTACDDSGSTPR